jgi:hypothetical protein
MLRLDRLPRLAAPALLGTEARTAGHTRLDVVQLEPGPHPEALGNRNAADKSAIRTGRTDLCARETWRAQPPQRIPSEQPGHSSSTRDAATE